MVGDKVSISYDKTDSNIINIAEFDNNNIGNTEKFRIKKIITKIQKIKKKLNSIK